MSKLSAKMDKCFGPKAASEISSPTVFRAITARNEQDLGRV